MHTQNWFDSLMTIAGQILGNPRHHMHTRLYTRKVLHQANFRALC